MVLTIVVLCVSGAWTNKRYRRFEQLPGHYDFRGEATRMAPRQTMAWLIPVLFSVMLLGLAGVFAFVPAEMQNGDPSTGLLLCCVTFLGSQGLILWLLHRWAQRQP